jgi:hypothetical protein
MKLRGFLSLVALASRSVFVHQKQRNNPCSSVSNASVDMEDGKNRRGVPVILALTAAEAN